MRHENKRQQYLYEWAMALISGEYTQGRSTLARLAGGQLMFCCLGVLAITHMATLQVIGSECKFLTYDEDGDLTRDKNHLPHSIATKLRINTNPEMTLCEHDKLLVIKCMKEFDRASGKEQGREEYYRNSVEAQQSLATLNDNGVPFPIIAQFILRYV